MCRLNNWLYFMKRFLLSAVVLGVLTFLGASEASAGGVLLTYAEAPGDQNSTLANTSHITFDNLPNPDGSLTWAGVGTYDDVAIINANQYGGADGTGNYLVQSTSIPPGGAAPTTTLTLNTLSAYFGLWWSAGDVANKLTFSLNGALVAEFTTATLVNVLPNSYKGNPTAPFLGLNSNEKYAFFNVYGDAGTTWNEITFTNLGASGFESDNHTTRITGWGDEPGEAGPEPGIPVMRVEGTTVSGVVAVPETSTWVMGFVALGAVVILMRRRTSHSG